MARITDDFDGDGRSEIAVVSSAGLTLLKPGGSAPTAIMAAPNGTRFGGWLLNTADNRFPFSGDFAGIRRSDLFVTSPWGISLLHHSGSTMKGTMIAMNGTRFGGWLLNTTDNRFGPVGDFDGDGRDEMFIASPWGIGILKLATNTFQALMMAPNGTRFGGWLLNTNDNRFGPVGDFDGDGCDEILISSPWGIGVLKLAGAWLSVPFMTPNGTSFGGWVLNTADNRFHTFGEFDGDRLAELLVTSPWGLGVLKYSSASATCIATVMMPNGTPIGGTQLNTHRLTVGPAADYDGDGRDEVLLASPDGLGFLKIRHGLPAVDRITGNGTRLGGWLLNTGDNAFTLSGDYDGDGRAEVVVSDDSGLGILQVNDGNLTAAAVVSWNDGPFVS